MAADPGTREVEAVPACAWATAGVVAFALAVLSALATPLMGLPDEPAHVIHATAVVHGQLVGDDEVRTDPATGWTRTETVVEVPAAYAELSSLPTCFAFQPTVPADCAPPLAGTAGRPTRASSTVGTYAPAWYAAVGWPTRLLPPTAALYGVRVVAAGIFAALVAVAVAGAWRAGARRWGLVGIAVALPPVAVHLAGGINPSGTEVVAAVALWATSAAVTTGAASRADLVRWMVAGIVLAVTRPLGPALVVGIPAVTAFVLGTGSLRELRRRPAVRRGAGSIALAAAAALAWSLWRGTLTAFSGFPAPEATALVAMRRSLGLVPERLAEMVGVLGWADVTLPRLLVAGWLVAAVVLLGAGVRSGDRRARVWLLALGAVVLVLPIAADVRSAPTIGFVWQGRYTLPVAAGLPVLAGILVDRQAVASRRTWGPATVFAMLAIGHVVALVAVLRRFRVGVEGDVLAALAAPGAQVGLLGWSLVGAAALVLLVPALTLRKGQCALGGEPSDRG